MNEAVYITDLERALREQAREVARIADLERTLLERDKEIAWLRNMLVNPPINGRIVQIAVAPGTEGYPDTLYALTTNGEVWCRTRDNRKFEWKPVPALPGEAR